MEVINSLLQFLGMGDMTFTNFGEFVPWFCKVSLCVLIICFIFKCFFLAVHKIERSLK